MDDGWMGRGMNKKTDTSLFNSKFLCSFLPECLYCFCCLFFNVLLLVLASLYPFISPFLIKGASLDLRLIRYFPSMPSEGTSVDAGTLHSALYVILSLSLFYLIACAFSGRDCVSFTSITPTFSNLYNHSRH